MTSFDEIIQEKKKSFKNGFIVGASFTLTICITIVIIILENLK